MEITPPLRLLIVDDHELIRVAFRSLMESTADLVVVGEAATAAAALDLARTLQPNVIVLDVRLPDGSGAQLAQTLRSVAPAARFLALSGFDDELLPALVGGASGFVSKTASSSDLLEAIRIVGHGGSYLSPSATSKVLERLRAPAMAAPTEEDRLALLSEQERRILSLIAEGKTNREIARLVGLSEHTVKIYVSALLKKLGLKRRSQAAAFVARRQRDPTRDAEAS